MTPKAAQREYNKSLVTRQTHIQFQIWESIQEFQINGNANGNSTAQITYKL